MSSSKNMKEWVRVNYLENLLSGTSFKDSTLVSFEIETLNFGTSFFAASLYTMALTVRSAANVIETHHLIVKMSDYDGIARLVASTDEFFCNEHLMYQELIPNLNRPEMFPKCYLSQANQTVLDCVFLEDLRPSGYRMSEDMVFLPNDHAIVALQLLGTYHGLCYAYKEKCPNNFRLLAPKFRESRFHTDPIRLRDQSVYFIKAMLLKGLHNIPDQGKYDPAIIAQITTMFQTPMKFFLEQIQPVEPLAVLCHGDFNRNNLMFKYDEETGKVVGVKMIDFQMVRYASPAIDLGFFIFMNIRDEQRVANFDMYLKVYHEALIKSLLEDVPQVDASKYTLEHFRDEFWSHAWYAYGIISFFTIIMERLEGFDMRRWIEEGWSEEQVAECVYAEGSSDVNAHISQVLTDILDELYLNKQ